MKLRRARRAPTSRLKRRSFTAVLVALAGALTIQACTDRNVVAVEIGVITISPGTASLLAGEQLQFRAVVEDTRGRALPRAEVVWSSDTPGLMIIDGEGVGEALSAGTVDVRATFRGVSGTASVTVIAAPVFELRRDTTVITSADTVVFFGAAGAQSPAAEVVQVRNGGGGRLDDITAEAEFTVGQPAGWLSPGLAGTEAPTTLTLTPQSATLPVGLYDARIRLTSPDDDLSPVFLPVRLSLMDFTVTESDSTTSVTEAGSTDDFTVVLDAAPLTDVVIDVSTTDSVEVTVAPTQITFTTANWAQPQTVTVTGQDELAADGDRQTDVTLAVVDSLSADSYDPIPDKAVVATTVDDDDAGVTVSESGAGTAVTEAGATDDFTVVLDAQPLTPVVFDVASTDSTEARVAPAALLFDDTNWDTPQAVTVTGVDDDVIDGPQAFFLTVTVNPASSDDAFDALAPDTVSATTTDDDSAGFTVVESDNTSEVNESGTTDDFTLVLGAQPTSDVVITLTNPDPTELALSAAEVTFTPADWQVVQTITLTGVDDDLRDGNVVTDVVVAIDSTRSDDDFDALAAVIVSVETVDNDTPGLVVTETGGTSVVDEGGATDSVAIALATQPQAGTVVVLDVASLDSGEVTATPTTLTFSPTNWLTPQVVTVQGEDERIDDGDQVTFVTISVNVGLSDPDFGGVAVDTVSVTTTDDDTAGFTLVQTAGGSVVDESGSVPDSFTVVLEAQPVDDVVLSLLSLDDGEVSVAPMSLTFTSSDWDTPKDVVLTGVDDILDDGEQFTLVAVSVVDAASDDAYDPLPDQSVNVTTTDDDSAAGLSVTFIAGTIVSESGVLRDDLTVELATEPASNVVVDITSQDTGEIAVSPATLTFTPADWAIPRTVLVLGVDDDIIDGDVSTLIDVVVRDVDSDDTFDGLSETVSATTTDDDEAGLDVVEIGQTSVNENGSTDDFTVALTAEPASDVVVAVTSGTVTEATAAPDSLTFTPATWSDPQTVTVTGVDDAADDDDQTSTITIAVDDARSDSDFAGLTESVIVTTFDDDGVGFTITEQGSTSVAESGTTDTFLVSLDAQPVSDVVLLINSTNTAEATVGPASLTFTTTDWATDQTVTVTGVNDDIDDGDQVTVITVVVDDAMSDPGFQGLAGQVLATTTDDDDAAFSIIGGASVSVTEAPGGGNTASFDVVLGSEPESDVVITVVSADIVEATVSPTQLTFTPTNWSDMQAVTVTGGDDLIDDGDVVTAVTIEVLDGSSDDTYDPLPPQTVDVTTVDNDTAGLTLAGTAGTTVAETGTTSDFTVVLDAQPVLNVVVVVASSNTAEATVVPVTLTFTPATWSTPKTVTVVGVDDAIIDGTTVSVISATVDDPTSDNAFDGLSDSFNVSTDDDDVAGFTIQDFGSLRVSESGSSDQFTVALDAQPSANVVIEISSGTPTEAIVDPATETLIFTPADWNNPQAVNVVGVNDAAVDGDQLTTLTVAVDPALTVDDNFDGLSSSVQVTTTDDDDVGFTITEIGSTIVPESGFLDNFTVELDAQPSSMVVFDITSRDGSEVSVTPTTLTFTSANWGQQTVTVMGVDDDLIDGSQETDVVVVVDNAQSDNQFDDLADSLVVTTTDDDVADFQVTGASALSVTEAIGGGNTDSFTVRLSAQPQSGFTVTLIVTSLDGGEVGAVPGSLVFTNGNWNLNQTVTLTGVDDAFVDGTQATTVRLQVDQAASDDAFDAMPDQTVQVNTVDDDVPSFTISEPGGTIVTEAAGPGNTDTFTIRLGTRPVLPVVVDVATGDPAEVGVSPTAITFDSITWATPQTITATGANEVIDDGDQITVITAAVDDLNSDNAFDGLSATISATTIDDDNAGFAITGAAGLSVTEIGGPDNFTIVLLAEPEADVVLSVTSSDEEEVTVATPTLTFTDTDWDSPHPVTIVGADDLIVDGSQFTTVTISVVDAASDPTFSLVPDQDVTVETLDNDSPGFSLGGAVGLSVSEGGSTDAFTVVLTTQPLTNVVLDVSSDDVSEAEVAPVTLTFTPGAWSVAQTVTITSVDDSEIDGDQVTTLRVSVDVGASDPAFAAVGEETADVTTTDDDGAGLTISEFGGVSVSEALTSDNFGVELTAEPASNVVLLIESTDTDETTVAPASLTFTPANWDVTQTVTATGVNDNLVDGDQITSVTINVDDGNSDPAFAGVAEETVLVTTTDDDDVGFTITETGPTIVYEFGGVPDQFGVVLDAEPTSSVRLTVTSADTGEATVSPVFLLFTTGNWNVAQGVVVTGVDDSVTDGDVQTTISVAVDVGNSDPAFATVPDGEVVATTIDNDGDLTGTLFEDTNGDGIQNGVELGLANVDVVVTDFLSVARTVTTDVNGVWTATAIPDGGNAAINVDETDPQFPAGAVQTAGTDPTSIAPVAGTSTAAGEDGYQLRGALTGTVFEDTDGNGTQNGVEPGLPNIDVVVTDFLGNPTTLVTNASGDWTATAIPDGGNATVNVDETDPQFPAGAIQTAGADPTSIAVIAGASTAAGDDGYQLRGTLTGTVFEDTDGNGTQNGVEPGLPNIDVVVTDYLGNPTTVVTNASGDWTLSAIPDGGNASVNVVETDPQFPTGAVQTAGTDPTSITVVAGASTAAGDDGYQLRGALSGTVFEDTNGDGTQNGVEPGLPNIDVVVTDYLGNPTTVVTNASGDWTVTGIPDGGNATVNVDETDPQFPAGGVQTADTDPTVIAIVAGATTPAGDDGYQFRGALSGTLFEDTDGNGTQNGVEPGLANIDVVVTDYLGAPTTVVTNASGDWTVSGIPDGGNATVNVDETDPQFPGGAIQTAGTDPSSVVVVRGTTTPAGDDGYQLRGTLTGTLFEDTDGNGTQNGVEPGLANIDVVVTDYLGNPTTVVTNASGDWTLSGIPDGGSATVNVDETDPQFPAGAVQTAGTDPTSIAVAAGTTTAAGDDGYQLRGTLTGTLFEDTDGNGAQNGVEPGLPDIDVVVTDFLGNPTTVVTNASGDWTATQIPDGGNASVNVDETDPQFPVGAFQTAGTDPTSIAVVAGASTSAGDDGYQLRGTLTGTVFEDTDGNGTQNGVEPGLANIDVVVTDYLANPTTVVTNASGDWTLSGVPDGGNASVDVDETDPQFPAGAVQTAGTDPSSIAVVAGASTAAGDDGYQLRGALSGTVFEDTDGNGTQNGVEPGLPDIDVVVTDYLGNPTTVVTDASGDWTLTGIPDGGDATVNVVETDPQFPDGGVQTAGTDPTVIAIVAGVTTPAGDDGYQFRGALSGTLFEDTDGNGTQNGVEPGLPSIDVVVTDYLGNPTTVVTDASGDWTATLIPDGGDASVDVDETDLQFPAGAFQTAGTNPNSVTVVRGTTTAAGDDGYQLRGDLNGTVFEDTNGNGVQDGVEPGLAGVDIIVTDFLANPTTVTTNGSGLWTATGIPDGGDAIIDVDEATLPAGALQTTDSDQNAATVVAGAVSPGGDDGYQLRGALTGTVFEDTNGDGVLNGAEVGLASIDVIVTDFLGNPTTVATDGSGVWTSPGIPDGGNATVDVDETDPDFPAGAVLSPGSTDPNSVAVVAGETTQAGDVGYQSPTQ